jgi:leucyl/phenylalanyl-tRNA--protein transferase
MIWLSKNDIKFPSLECVSEEGILALGGDLSIERLLEAYKNGIFPWYSAGEPIVWYCPNPRMVLFFDKIKVSKSLRKILKKQQFAVTFNQNFKEVIHHCKSIQRKEDLGTWITDEMEEAYVKLHEIGKAKSVEVWQNDQLVGGLYGVDLGTVFCGESMFSKVSNASKVAFVYLVERLKKESYKFLDCQVYNSHLASLGAEEISREFFLKLLNPASKNIL